MQTKEIPQLKRSELYNIHIDFRSILYYNRNESCKKTAGILHFLLHKKGTGDNTWKN